MKFLLIVLAIHFIGELISNKTKNRKDEENTMTDEAPVTHPAEYDIR